MNNKSAPSVRKLWHRVLTMPKKCPGVNREWYTDIIKEANEAVRKKVKDLIRDMKNLKQHKSIPGEKGFRITNCYNCYNPSLV